ncbi:MAG: DUF885 domain-containing protein [Hyphomonadaceae bacterium]
MSQMSVRLLFSAGFALLLAACSPGGQQTMDERVATESAGLAAYLDQEFEEELQRSPESLTQLGRKERYGELDDRSLQAMDEDLAWRRESVAEMKEKFNVDMLDEEARTSYDMWAEALDSAEARNRFRNNRYIFSRGGAHTGLPNFLINFHKVDTPEDMDAYNRRLAAIPGVIDQLLERAQISADAGVRMPKFAYVQAIDLSDRVVSGKPFDDSDQDSPLWADAKAKIAGLKEAGLIDDEREAELSHLAMVTMSGNIKPAYERLIAWLETDMVNATDDNPGAMYRSEGADFYASALKIQTTTDMTADQIHELGLSEVARIRSEMEAIKQKVGFEGSLQDFFTFMRTDRRFYLPNTDEGRQQYIKLAEGYLGEMKKRLPEYFGRLPKADLIVKRVEPFREEPGGAQHYFPGAPDGSRPGVFYAHLSDMNAMSTYQLESIAYHEGLPGHHMQISIAQELTGLPVFRTQYMYTAYTEGWGLYSEALAKEMGAYQDPYSDFGRLAGEMWRAIRLVVDTGIHAKGWSEEQAVQYFKDNSPIPDAAIRSEVRRYIVNPGQATCYKIGMLKLQELRDRARAKLGDTFSYPEFHDEVLGGGSLPLPVLEARVDRWIERKTQDQAAQ